VRHLALGDQAQVQRQRYAIGDHQTRPANGEPSLEQSLDNKYARSSKSSGSATRAGFQSRAVVQTRPFFMENTLRRGASFREVAGFLCRPEGEVRAKAIELGIHPAEEPCASRTKRPAAGIFLAEGKGPRMVSLDDFQNVYCPTCRRVQPARFDFLKADAYIDHDSVDIVCSECQSAIASLHADKPITRWAVWGRAKLESR